MSNQQKIPGKNLERSNKIISWLKEHDLISKNALCTKVGYDVTSLYKIMSGAGSYVAIPVKHLDDLEKILKEYGYSPEASVN